MKQYLDKLSDNRLVIFLFHGVIEKSTHAVRNYTKKHLEREIFLTLMQDLKRNGHAMSMDEVVIYHKERRPFPPRAYAITLDDGFENNYSIAAPILNDLGIPATFYVTTDFVDQNHMSWIDRIEYCIESVTQGSIQFPWSPRESRFTTREEKINLLDEIRKHVKQDPSINQDLFVKDIFRQCGKKEIFTSDDPLDKKMSWQQVRELASSPLFAVGGHSHRHATLSFLNPAALKEEIVTSCQLLIQKAGIAPIYYSYPEGLVHCYSETVITELKDQGIICCPTAEEGLNTHETDLFHLKRIFVV